MLKVKETSAAEVYAHALDHGDRPVIHGAEIDYDDVHDGVHWHCDLLMQAITKNQDLRSERNEAAYDLAVIVDVWEKAGDDPRQATDFADALAKYRRLSADLVAGYEASAALRAKADQDAAFATYGVPA